MRETPSKSFHRKRDNTDSRKCVSENLSRQQILMKKYTFLKTYEEGTRRKAVF